MQGEGDTASDFCNRWTWGRCGFTWLHFPTQVIILILLEIESPAAQYSFWVCSQLALTGALDRRVGPRPERCVSSCLFTLGLREHKFTRFEASLFAVARFARTSGHPSPHLGIKVSRSPARKRGCHAPLNLTTSWPKGNRRLFRPAGLD